MKKVLFFSLVMLLLTGCKSDGESFNTDKVGDTPMNQESCSKNNQVMLESTDTINASELWSNSIVCDNLVFDGQYIKHDDSTQKAVLETNEFMIESFTELVPSWNVYINSESAVSILVAIGNENGFSNYYTAALWRQTYKTSFKNQGDDYGEMNIDTIIPKQTIDRIKFKIVFAKTSTNQTKLGNLSITTKQPKNYDVSILEEHIINVPQRQQLSIPLIGNSICSPTSTSMVLSYYNHLESQEKVSEIVYDQGSKIYGNWSFNASYAGGFDDLYSRVEYLSSLDTIMDYIKQDIPLVLSIRTTQKEDLIGSIMAYPAGHLVVLTGFKKIDDEWYAIVNDPAEYEDDNVLREYKLTELLEAFRGYGYVIKTNDFN